MALREESYRTRCKHPRRWIEYQLRLSTPALNKILCLAEPGQMMYTRASASDYDDFQAKGWSTKELLPLMKKHETYQRACNNRDLHGFEGPIKVSFGNYTYPIAQDFLRATESQGIPTTDDLQDLTTGHGAEHWLKWINRDTGRRSDSAHAYIHSTMR